MFGSKKVETSSNSGSSSLGKNALNSIVQGTNITGDIVAKNDIRIDGTIIGTLKCEAKVIIGPTGKVEGEVICINALIEGRFEGKLIVDTLLHIKDKAEVIGSVKTDKLIVDPGAEFNVTCDMSNTRETKKIPKTKN